MQIQPQHSKKLILSCFFILLFYGLFMHFEFHRRIIAYSDKTFNQTFLPPTPYGESLPEMTKDNHIWFRRIAQKPIKDLSESFIFDIDFSSDGRILAVSSPSEKIEVWDNDKRQTIFLTENNPGRIAIMHDGTAIAWEMRAKAPNDEFIVITDLPSGEELNRFILEKTGRRIDNLQFSPDGKWLVYSKSGVVNFLDVETGQKHHHFVGDRFDLSPNGDWLALADSRAVKIYSTQNLNGAPVSVISNIENIEPQHIKFNPFSTALAIAGKEEVAIVHLNDTNTSWTNLLSVGHYIKDIDFSPDGNLLAVADRATTLLAIDSPNSPNHIEILRTIKSQPYHTVVFEIDTIAFHPNGKLLLISPSAGNRNKLETWSISSLNSVREAYLFILGLTIATFGYWYLVLIGFRRRFWHGLLILLLTPIVTIIYGILNFKLTKAPLILMGLGIGLQVLSLNAFFQ